MKRAVIVICDSLRRDLITPEDAPFSDRARPALGAVRQSCRRLPVDDADECRVDRDRLPAGAPRAARQHDGARRGRRARLPVGRQARFPRPAAPRHRPHPAHADDGRAARAAPARARSRFRTCRRGRPISSIPTAMAGSTTPPAALAPAAGHCRPKRGWRSARARPATPPSPSASAPRCCASAPRRWRLLWLSEPDYTGHHTPLGSPGASPRRSPPPTPMSAASPRPSPGSIPAARRSCSSSARITAWRASPRRSTSTGCWSTAGLKRAPGSSDVVVAPNGTAALIYFAEPESARVAEVARFLETQRLGRPGLHRRRPRRDRPADRLAGADRDHDEGRRPRQPVRRRAATAISSATRSEPKDMTGFGQHGGLGANEQRPFLFVSWRRLRARAAYHQRSSLIDIAPTVLRHLGLAAAGLDGRPLPRYASDAAAPRWCGVIPVRTRRAACPHKADQ